MSTAQTYRTNEVEYEARSRMKSRGRISHRRGGKSTRRSNSPKSSSGMHRRRVKKISW
jgi:hypothetical protein